MSNPLIFVFGICFGVILSVSLVVHMPSWFVYFRSSDNTSSSSSSPAAASSTLSSSALHADPRTHISHNNDPNLNSNQIHLGRDANSRTSDATRSANGDINKNNNNNNNNNKLTNSDNDSDRPSSLLQRMKARTQWSPGSPAEAVVTATTVSASVVNTNSNSNSNSNSKVSPPPPANGQFETDAQTQPLTNAVAHAWEKELQKEVVDSTPVSDTVSRPSDVDRQRRRRKDKQNAALSSGAGGGIGASGGNFSVDDVVVTINNKRHIVLYKEVDNFVVREAVPEDKAIELLSSQDSIGSDGVRYYSHPPWTPYHSQSYVTPLTPPYIPTLNSVKAYRETLKELSKGDNPSNNVLRSYTERTMPNMKMQKADYEGDNLKFHLCNGVFEAYSASYVTTREHMLEVKSEKYNLSFVNCEMASFIHMRESTNFYKNKYGKGLIMQSIDVLDLSVIHLSAFERSSLKHKFKLWKSKKDLDTAWKNIDPVIETAKILEARINPKKTGKPLLYTEEAKRTVVVMPFLGGAMGAGHSVLGNRFEYLKACFWSFYEFIPNIVIGVSRKEDVHWGFFDSGLPFFDILLLEGLPKGASLPVGTTQYVKRLFQSGNTSWLQFDYVFFSESDQILISRVLPLVHYHLKLYPTHMILPHRLMPYSGRVIQEVHNKSKDQIVYNDWMYQSCCLERQNCQERKSWHPLAHEHVPVINYYGLYVPLGNVNFLDEKYRACEMMSYTPDFCP